MLDTLKFILPALIANAFPVIFLGSGLIKVRTPIDLNIVLPDGKRLLGPNKTVEGFLVGVLGGVLVGFCYYFLGYSYLTIMYGLISGLGAMIGDIVNSFIKRRLNIPSGEPLVPLDQLSFIIVAYGLVRLTNIDYLCFNMGFSLKYLSLAIVMVMILHPMSNLVAYIFKLKDKPW